MQSNLFEIGKSLNSIIMKKLVLILVLFFTLQQSFSYTWQSYGPDSIQAINFCLCYTPYSIICSTYGMYLVDSGVLEYFSYPAKDAAQLNNDTILFVAGNGSYSDGIYCLNVQTSQVEVIHYCINPNFIEFYDYTGVYYAGYEDGLLKSEDGLNWEEVPFFTGKDCIRLEYYSEHVIVNVSADITHLYLSADSGTNWFESSNNPGWITNIEFEHLGKLYGIFPDNSYSSGLWYSDDYGDNWNVEFYSTNMTDVCYVLYYDKLLVSWKSPGEKNEGIAVYDPYEPPPGLTFINDGLPNTEINRIKVVSLLGGSLIFVCTDSGVYTCWDYFVGINEHSNRYGSISVFPNPVSNQTTIHINLSDIYESLVSISILNNQGIKVDEIEVEGYLSNEINIKWNKGDLPAGVYYLVIKTEKETLIEKFIIL